VSPILLALAPFVLFPAAVFLFTPAWARRVALAAGTAVAITSSWILGGGPDNPLYLVPIAAGGISGGALLIELVAQLRRLIKGRKPAHG
jgi:hypothetical protein